MTDKALNEAIILKQHICEKEYDEISNLERICHYNDKTNLKLELDYRINVVKNTEVGLSNINEFLYYIDDVLISYMSISSFGGKGIGEVNGMTHPDFRRKGLFKKLFGFVSDECRRRSYKKILLLSDGNSTSGIEFINSVQGIYDFSEYRMKCLGRTILTSDSPVTIRKAIKLDEKEIVKQNEVYFGDHIDEECSIEREEQLNKFIYMVQLDEKVIGKIEVEYDDNYAFISGVGILPDFRGKGYGKAALTKVLKLINEKGIYNTDLDVECKNKAALNLYKHCGFSEQSVMNYYKYSSN